MSSTTVLLVTTLALLCCVNAHALKIEKAAMAADGESGSTAPDTYDTAAAFAFKGFQRVYLIPVGRFVDESGKVKPIAFGQRLDTYLPSKLESLEGRVKCIGGLIEAGENPATALKREINEEHPGWFDTARLGGTSRRWGGRTAVDSMIYVGSGEFKGSTYGYFAALVDVGPLSFRRFVNSCQESVPLALTIPLVEKLNEEDLGLPGVKEAYMAALQLVQSNTPQ
eukprot:GFYU01003833.1.p1 GENE.GFYU01003833.1~~GFYU01003833.1.p1  ORF type:complete len:225 (-),score=76.56 GFYU01003833.1:78-752(-)